MNKIKDFKNFENISESRVYFVRNLSKRLYELANDKNPDTTTEWIQKLIDSQGKRIESDTTFLDLDGENFSFSKESDLKNQMINNKKERCAWHLFDDESETFKTIARYLDRFEEESIISSTPRGQVKIGKIIKKLLPDIPDKELEKVINRIRAQSSGFEIKLVNGSDISKYYKKEFCNKQFLNYGNLANSCMMDKEVDVSNIFDIYTKNPETCQLAVLLDSAGELVARALVWKIDEISSIASSEYEDNFYSKFNLDWERKKVNRSSSELNTAKVDNIFLMDRVYFTKDWMEEYFHKWARERNMIVKYGSTFLYKGSIGRPILTVKVKKIAYRKFPYLDTFKYYDVQRGILSNDKLVVKGFELTSTSGGFHGKNEIDKATNFIRRFKDYFKK